MNFNVGLIIYSDPFTAHKLIFLKNSYGGIYLRYLTCSFLRSDFFDVNRFHSTLLFLTYLSSLTVIHAPFISSVCFSLPFSHLKKYTHSYFLCPPN